MNIPGSILIEAATLVAAVAFNRASVSNHGRRIGRLEAKFDALPKSYVPRTEVELAVRGIESHARHTNAMIQAMIESRPAVHGIQAAAAGKDFAQITIEGIDGNGGLHRWEGTIPFFYLDSRKIDGLPAPLVTVGIGCALDLDEALTLPFTIAGRPATLQEIAHDYATVQQAPFGHVAQAYAAFSNCRLSEAAMEDLVRKRFAVFLCALRKLFPGFDDFPETVKAGCLDLIYGLGVAGLSAPHYPSLRAAVLRKDWRAAADECGSDTAIEAYDLRNEARRQLFLQAVQG